MATTTIYDGSAGSISGNTPFGTYDSDSTFQTDGPKVANWCAKRIGYPIIDIELQDTNFFACFEEAVTEYSSQVNRFNIRENLLTAKGSSTGSSLTHRTIKQNSNQLIGISDQYGQEAGVGGDMRLYSGSISCSKGIQAYDLTDTDTTFLESGTASTLLNDGTSAYEIRKVFYESSPAMTRFFDPHIGSGLGSQQMLTQFGWGSYSPAINYLLMPMYDDLLRVQAIEFNDMIRKSAYSFHIVKNRLHIFPNPTTTFNLRFQYLKKSDRTTLITDEWAVSDFSNIGYDNMTYDYINDPGKQWIKKYTLALVKELLGSIRGKYGSMPIPNGEVSLDGDTLRSEGAAERDALVAELREDLEAASRRMLMERRNDEANFQQETVNKVPLHIYIG
tara:strand:- start:25964 stop:27133 length:1170 start_codon:yes stop_codon:yes gene_type:complete